MNWITFDVFILMPWTFFGDVESAFKTTCYSDGKTRNLLKATDKKTVKCFLQYQLSRSHSDTQTPVASREVNVPYSETVINQILLSNGLKFRSTDFEKGNHFRQTRSTRRWRRRFQSSVGPTGGDYDRKPTITKRFRAANSDPRKESGNRRNSFGSFVGPQGGEYDRRPIITRPFPVGIVDPRTADGPTLQQTAETTDENGSALRTSSNARVSEPSNGKLLDSASFIRDLNKEPAPTITHPFKIGFIDDRTPSRNTFAISPSTPSLDGTMSRPIASKAEVGIQPEPDVTETKFEGQHLSTVTMRPSTSFIPTELSNSQDKNRPNFLTQNSKSGAIKDAHSIKEDVTFSDIKQRKEKDTRIKRPLTV